MENTETAAEAPVARCALPSCRRPLRPGNPGNMCPGCVPAYAPFPRLPQVFIARRRTGGES